MNFFVEYFIIEKYAAHVRVQKRTKEASYAREEKIREKRYGYCKKPCEIRVVFPCGGIDAAHCNADCKAFRLVCTRLIVPRTASRFLYRFVHGDFVA